MSTRTLKADRLLECRIWSETRTSGRIRYELQVAAAHITWLGDSFLVIVVLVIVACGSAIASIAIASITVASTAGVVKVLTLAAFVSTFALQFDDEHTSRAVVRGGSYYQIPREISGFYFRQPLNGGALGSYNYWMMTR
jgi:hypothetical protein